MFADGWYIRHYVKTKLKLKLFCVTVCQNNYLLIWLLWTLGELPLIIISGELTLITVSVELPLIQEVLNYFWSRKCWTTSDPVSVELPLIIVSVELPLSTVNVELPLITVSVEVPLITVSVELPLITVSVELPIQNYFWSW